MDEVTKLLVMIVNNSSPSNLTIGEAAALVEEIKQLIRDPHKYEVKEKSAGRRPRT